MSLEGTLQTPDMTLPLIFRISPCSKDASFCPTDPRDPRESAGSPRESARGVREPPGPALHGAQPGPGAPDEARARGERPIFCSQGPHLLGAGVLSFCSLSFLPEGDILVFFLGGGDIFLGRVIFLLFFLSLCSSFCEGCLLFLFFLGVPFLFCSEPPNEVPPRCQEMPQQVLGFRV